MEIRNVVLLLLLLSPVVHAGSTTMFTGVELVRSNFGERTGVHDGLLAAGVDVQFDRNLAIGSSFGLQDQDYPEGVVIKGDIYGKYRFLPDSAIDPFLSGGFTAASLKKYECGLRSTRNGSAFFVQTVCESKSFVSSGLSYQVGVALDLWQNTKLSLFFAQFFGTNDVRMNMVGINASF